MRWGSCRGGGRLSLRQQSMDTTCFDQTAKLGIGHHLWLVTHLKTRIMVLVQHRGGEAFTLRKSFANIKPKKYMLKAGAEPELLENVHFSPGSLSLCCHIHGWGFFSLVNFNSERLSTSWMLSSNIRGSKRRIKMDFKTDHPTRVIYIASLLYYYGKQRAFLAKLSPYITYIYVKHKQAVDPESCCLFVNQGCKIKWWWWFILPVAPIQWIT